MTRAWTAASPGRAEGRKARALAPPRSTQTHWLREVQKNPGSVSQRPGRYAPWRRRGVPPLLKQAGAE